MLNRGWAMILLLAWTPIVLGAIILMVLHERELNAIPYSTGMRVAAMLLLIASMIAVPLVLPTSRRRWTLFADQIEIRERPLVPLIGASRSARLGFADIAAARLGEMLSGAALFELQARDGRRFRLLVTTIGKGRQARQDHEGFAAFIETIRGAIDRSGVPRPPGEELRMATSGLTGVAILGVATALLAFFILAGLYIVAAEGEPGGLQLIAFMTPLFLIFGGLFLNRLRKWRAAAAMP